jgi:serine/threonine protein kinase
LCGLIDIGRFYKAKSVRLPPINQDLYSSIEQLELEDVHPADDIWSLGIIIYKLIAKEEAYP